MGTNHEAANLDDSAALYEWRLCSNCSTESSEKAAGSAQAASADWLQTRRHGQRHQDLGGRLHGCRSAGRNFAAAIHGCTAQCRQRPRREAVIGICPPASEEVAEQMSDQEARAETTLKHEATVNTLLRRAAKRTRPSQVLSVVLHGRETDANREFASDREGDVVVWFWFALPIFVIIHVICVKLGAI
ncbi:MULTISPECIES: hypothetical protein [unclassified Bradyrhizobium]|uniref:hypothetical protein n=1 Tax=unclassified Bradyrhizobium TaxID=2631580 RepID=UPI001FF9E76E|nr:MULTISPECIES: hypothetical protein [unclassified Bradyrhizobium]MCK1712094.1 hypothetical protein [Bradyrhizobium sp. 143]MCK1732070.1 hypothetical protein [Bradyrhizobium sp. 142]